MLFFGIYCFILFITSIVKVKNVSMVFTNYKILNISSLAHKNFLFIYEITKLLNNNEILLVSSLKPIKRVC